MTNHINFIEVPLLYTHLQPRPVTGFVKTESWNNPAFALLFDFWGAIPVRRGEADLNAIRLGLKALKEGKILAVTPEGTRTNNGQLIQGHPGVALLALQSQAPVLPVAYYGSEKYRTNLPRLRRTPFQIVVGAPFWVRPPARMVNKETRQKIMDAIMYQLAALLPPEYRGYYRDFSETYDSYLQFEHPDQNNLRGLQAAINPTSHAALRPYSEFD